MVLPQAGQGRVLDMWGCTGPSPLSSEVCTPPLPGVDGETEASRVKGLPTMPASGHGARALGGGWVSTFRTHTLTFSVEHLVAHVPLSVLSATDSFIRH